MTPTKILIGQAVIVFAIIALSLWAATQWTAHQLGYQPRLGLPWFTVGDQPIYYPWRLLEWWYAYEAYAPSVFTRAGTVAAGGGVLGAVTAVIGSVWRARQTTMVTTYGSARWATPADVRTARLTDASGVFLGR
ncbi:MAG: conjugal transfer protein TraG, partial [Acidobacteriota bacterium]